jgi:uncharacterized NAD-dependent epimerase/dehydratase family protein
MKPFKKAVLLVEGAKDIFHAKTASLLLRYKKENISYLLDSTHSESKPNIFSSISKIPTANSFLQIIKDINRQTSEQNNLKQDSLKQVNKKPDALIICLMLPEGVIPNIWLDHIVSALKNDIDVINPLHIDLGTITEIKNALGGISDDSTPAITKFNNVSASVHNVRIPPDDIELFKLEVLKTRAKRVLTVGSDCNIGKMLTTLELNESAKKRGINSSFIATGQIGIIVKGSGIAVDRVISDFVPGAVERLILPERDKDLLFVEGQGSIFQPIYSAVTMGLIHGTAPDAMILCHAPNRKKLRYTNINVSDFKTLIKIHEDIAGMIHPSKILGISLNCHDMSNEKAMDEIKRTEDITGLPATDPIKFGLEKLTDKLLKELF